MWVWCFLEMLLEIIVTSRPPRSGAHSLRQLICGLPGAWSVMTAVSIITASLHADWIRWKAVFSFYAVSRNRKACFVHLRKIPFIRVFSGTLCKYDVAPANCLRLSVRQANFLTTGFWPKHQQLSIASGVDQHFAKLVPMIEMPSMILFSTAAPYIHVAYTRLHSFDGLAHSFALMVSTESVASVNAVTKRYQFTTSSDSIIVPCVGWRPTAGSNLRHCTYWCCMVAFALNGRVSLTLQSVNAHCGDEKEYGA